MSDRLSRTTRTMPIFFRTLYELTKSDDYLGMTEKQFVGRGMNISGGRLDPNILAENYKLLMAEAGGGKDG